MSSPFRLPHRLAAFWRKLWGCGRGPARQLSPQARLASGGMALAACLLAPPSAAGVGIAATAAAGWLAACGPPVKVLALPLAGAVAGLLPAVVLAGAGVGWGEGVAPALGVAVALALRGAAAAVAAMATAATLTPAELAAGLAALGVPRPVAAILLQILHQTGVLLEEVGRIGTALAVRGGGRGGVRLAAALPGVWLPRLVGRGERVAVAMEVRGVGAAELTSGRRSLWRLTDPLALLPLAVLTALTAALRWTG